MAIQQIKSIMSRIIQNSETVKILNEFKTNYGSMRANNINSVRAITSSVITTGKDFGVINSIFAGIGAIGGTITIPIPGGAIIGADLMVKGGRALVNSGKTILNFIS